MRRTQWVLFAWVLASALCFPRMIQADKLQSATRIEGKCNDKGGVFFPPDKQGVYACLNPDGSGVVCGGNTKDLRRCDSWPASARSLPPHARHLGIEEKRETLRSR